MADDSRSPSTKDQPRAVAGRLAAFYGATFAATGVHLPFWPVWLASRGLDAAEIGLLLAASFWPRVITSLLIPHFADRRDERKRPMVVLVGLTFAGFAAFGLASSFWAYLALSLATGAAWAAVLPLGEALALRQAQSRGIVYGRVRLWGSITFILAAVGAGRWLELRGPGIVLALVLALLALTFVACLLLPDGASGVRAATPQRLVDLVRRPGFVRFVLAAGLIQVSHALYYGFASLHWRAHGLADSVIGWLWAGGVIAEVVLFSFAGRLVRRLRPLELLTLAGALAVLRWCLTASGTGLALLIPAQALHAASFGAAHLAAMHHIQGSTPPALQASAQGFYAAFGIALLFGLVTPVAGWLYGVLGGAGFLVMAAIALIGTMLAGGLARA
ncbi:MAG: MFS transporter [Geminicoccaceae bacterium]